MRLLYELRRAVVALPLAAVLLSIGCARDNGGAGADRAHSVREALTSADARFYDFEFDSQLHVAVSDDLAARGRISTQLMYSAGQLNGEMAVGQYPSVQITSLDRSAT